MSLLFPGRPSLTISTISDLYLPCQLISSIETSSGFAVTHDISETTRYKSARDIRRLVSVNFSSSGFDICRRWRPRFVRLYPCTFGQKDENLLKNLPGIVMWLNSSDEVLTYKFSNAHETSFTSARVHVPCGGRFKIWPQVFCIWGMISSPSLFYIHAKQCIVTREVALPALRLT